MLLKTDGYYCEMGWEGKGGAGGQGQDGRAASQLSRRNLWVPGEAENNLNAAELKIPCLAQVCSSSSTAERMLSADRGIRSPVSPGLAVLPACLGPVPRCSVSSCQGPRLPVRAGTASPVVKSTSPSGLSLTVPGGRAFHHWKVCTDRANKSHRTRSGCVLHE